MKEELNDEIKRLIDEKRYEEIPTLLNFYSEKFWIDEYPLKTLEEKIDYWSGSIRQQIRWNNESGFDEMNVFSKVDYENWKKKEPLIDYILKEVILILKLNSDKVYKALSE
jgi:hypothetical protein